jgi:hypothetical protein
VTLRERTSLVLTGVLLLLSLGASILAAHATVGAVRSFQRESTLTSEGDVQTIQPWMTVPYISRVYHVPEPYLYRNLRLPVQQPIPHVTLHALATHTKQPVDKIIHNLQTAILNYRKTHPDPTPKSHKGGRPVPGRTTT